MKFLIYKVLFVCFLVASVLGIPACKEDIPLEEYYATWNSITIVNPIYTNGPKESGWEAEIEIEDEHGKTREWTSEYSLTKYVQSYEDFTAHLLWSDNELMPNPSGELKIRLDFSKAWSEESYSYETKVKLEPGATYDWDPVANTFDKTGKNAACHIGTFKDNSCGGGTVWKFYEDGRGSAFYPDCNGYCDGAKFEFKYSLEKNKMNISYTSAVVCGEPQDLPDDDRVSYDCGLYDIKINTTTYERQ